MPVGTLGTVKGVTADQLRETGAQMVLGNTYHLALRPGEEIVRELGGLHEFMRWDGPILTDSGGFQLFSLAQMTKVTEEEAMFRSHIDGSLLHLSPERAVAIQEALGSDVAMVLDHVVALPATDEVIDDAMERTIRWAARCQQAGDAGRPSAVRDRARRPRSGAPRALRGAAGRARFSRLRDRRPERRRNAGRDVRGARRRHCRSCRARSRAT